MTMTDTAPAPAISANVTHLGLFETPIAVARLENAEAMTAELEAAIRERKATHPGLDRSNLGGWHSDAGMPTWGGAAARALVQQAIQVAQGMTHLEGYDWAAVQWAVQMWANVSPPGAMNVMHVHPNNLWAAVFYVDLGLGDRNFEEVGGEFYVEDPRFPGAFMHAAGFRPIGADGEPQQWQRDFRPRRGDLIVFPAWLRHGVRPYRGDRERISIAMNLDPVLPAGGPR
jgi:uncharacterized protein (TIGR02466 family)